MFILWFRLALVMTMLTIGGALSVALIRLAWHAGSCFKRKSMLSD